MFVYLGDSDALEEVQGGSQAGLYAADEQSGPSIYDSLYIGEVNVGFSEEESEDWDDIGAFASQDFWAHGDDSVELECSEVHRVD